MYPAEFDASWRSEIPDVIAPDGCEVRVLCSSAAGSMATFTLASAAISKAMQHRSVEKIWYVVRSKGRMWRKKKGEREVITELSPGASVMIPIGTLFSFVAMARNRLKRSQ